MTKKIEIVMDDYFEILEVVKKRITESQYSVMTAANIERNILFWNIGRVIVEHSNWGNNSVRRNFAPDGCKNQLESDSKTDR